MNTFAQKLKHEMLEMIPPAIFFFVAFQLLAITKALMLREYGIEVSTFLTATIGALIVAKVILLADFLPFVNLFPDKPIIYNIAWKTTLYWLGSILVRYAEHLIPFLREHESFGAANRHLLAEIVWPHFWAVQLWLVLLLFIYCTAREVIRIRGKEEIMRLFFSKPGNS